MNVPNTDFTLAGTLDELKAKGQLVVHGAHRPILVVHDRGGAYIACTNPNYRANEPLRRWVQAEPDWSYLELATGHDAMILAPDALSEMLMKE